MLAVPAARVLLVDDSDDLRGFVAEVLEQAGAMVTAVATGRRVFAAADFAEATRIAGDLKEPLLAGGDARPPGGKYEVANSPRALSDRGERWRPLVLVSTYGTKLLANARGCRAVFVACE